MNFIIELISKILTLLVFPASFCRFLRSKIKTFLYGYNVIKKARVIGKDLKVRGFLIL